MGRSSVTVSFTLSPPAGTSPSAVKELLGETALGTPNGATSAFKEAILGVLVLAVPWAQTFDEFLPACNV